MEIKTIEPGKNVDPSAAVQFVDRFSDRQRPGGVIGTWTPEGIQRRGVDREDVLASDNGALRIQPLIKPGWGRAGISYGPYPRQNGLAFGTFLLNGHNTSQNFPTVEELPKRIRWWLSGSETERPATRLRRLACARQSRFLWRRFLHWIRNGSKFFKAEIVDENLSLGWFPADVSYNPVHQGNSLTMHALGSECGELWARVATAPLPTVSGIQNVPLFYFVVLRERGAAYYAASLPGVPGLDSWPRMRLLAIDSFSSEPTVYAGIHQSVLGQIGFRVDTRVYGTQVARLDEFAQWYGSAHGADKLTGEGLLHLSPAENGGNWSVSEGSFCRSPAGTVAQDKSNLAVLGLDKPAGLIHLLVTTSEHPVSAVALVWRFKDEDNYWSFEVGTQGCQISITEEGMCRKFPAVKEVRLAPNFPNAIQVSDDGEGIRLCVNAKVAFGTTLRDTRLQDGTGVGIKVSGPERGALLHSFEAHPREIPVPETFDLGKPWVPPAGKVVIVDDFKGAAGDLAGRATSIGSRTWGREIGRGVLQLTGQGAARVLASLEKPCPGRTAYTVPWHNPQYADAEVIITPPGTRRGLKERGRGGLIFWQDARNYITLSVFLDDYYGTSIAAFFYVDGYEELYDAVWTNVGTRIHWGMPYDFRVVFDGRRFLAYVNGEPVLYRALSDIYPDWDRLLINKTGLVVNWEWGNDTGTIFQDFSARDLS